MRRVGLNHFVLVNRLYRRTEIAPRTEPLSTGSPTTPTFRATMSLRISLTVHGQKRAGNRVVFLVNETGAGSEYAVAESVVLRRWRQRTLNGYRFQGARLAPSFWWALSDALGPKVRVWKSFDADCIANLVHQWRKTRKSYLKLPHANVINAVIAHCGTDNVAKLIDRHAARRESKLSGVPDLFLYATNASGKPCMGRFVEVKKPIEKVREDQKEEIAFLTELGLKARVLRLRAA